MKSKGITLISLIISIIILLILSTVSITLLTKNGIIGKSKEAVANYSEAEFLEKVNLAIGDAGISKYVTDVNYVTVVNKILKSLKYPQMNNEGSELANEADRTKYEGKITITSGVDYSYPESNSFKIVYNEKEKQIIIWKNDGLGELKRYVWNNLSYAGTESLLTEDNAEDWYWSESNGEVTILGFNKLPQMTAEGKINITIPNVLVDKNGNKHKVTNIQMESDVYTRTYDQFANHKIINTFTGGTVTVSSNVNIKNMYVFLNIEKIILRDNITVTGWGNNKIKDLDIGYGCNINTSISNANLTNVTIANGCKLYSTIFYETNKLTEESVNNIIRNGTITTSYWHPTFKNINFVNEINIVIPDGKTIKQTYFFAECTNIKNITIGDNCTLVSAEPSGGMFRFSSPITIENVTIGNNCTINSMFYNQSNLTINSLKVGSNTTWYEAYNFDLGLIENGGTQKVEIGDGCNSTTFKTVTRAKNLKELVIKNDMNISNSFYDGAENETLEKITIGNDAKINGKLIKNCTSLKEVVIGDKAKLTTFMVSGVWQSTFFGNAENYSIIFGEGASIDANTFNRTSTAPKSVTLYLTQAQKNGEEIQSYWDAALVTRFEKTKTTYSDKIVWTK